MSETVIIIFCKLLVAHLATDFFLQKGSWTSERVIKHFRSFWLYVHGSIAGITTYIIIGDWSNWQIPLLIATTHTLTDGWKSYQKSTIAYFLLDQLLHIAVLIIAWIILTGCNEELRNSLHSFFQNKNNWIYGIGFILMTTPLGYTISFAVENWRMQFPNSNELAVTGRWIGMLERLLIFSFILFNQYETVGLLIIAKFILRFAELRQPDYQKRADYVLIGTLISTGSAVIVALIVKLLAQ